MSEAKLIITESRVEAYIASALRVLGWLTGVILRLNAAGRSLRLGRALSLAERGVECTLFLKAVALYGPPPQRRRAHPRSTPKGFRRAASNSGSFFRSANIRARKAKPLARVLALVEALMKPERAVAYFFKQICKGLRLTRLVLVAPAAENLTGSALFAAPSTLLDSS